MVSILHQLITNLSIYELSVSNWGKRYFLKIIPAFWLADPFLISKKYFLDCFWKLKIFIFYLSFKNWVSEQGLNFAIILSEIKQKLKFLLPLQKIMAIFGRTPSGAGTDGDTNADAAFEGFRWVLNLFSSIWAPNNGSNVALVVADVVVVTAVEAIFDCGVDGAGVTALNYVRNRSDF